MIQLHPKETFTIVRQIEDHTDSSTYYVQAVVRNAKTDALLATINLDDKGDRRFSKTYIVPADPSGEGVWISILTSVYTDSGYTTKSGSYADKMESYLVQARPVFNPNYPVPTGPDVDYKKIRNIIEDVVSKNKVTQLKVTEMEPYIASLRKDIKESTSLLSNIPQKPLDLSSVINNNNKHSAEIKSLITKIDIPEFDYSELRTIFNRELQTFKDSMLSSINDSALMSENQKKEIMRFVNDAFSKNIEKYKKAEMIQGKLDELVNIAKSEEPEEKEEEIKVQDKPKEDMKIKRITRLMQRL